VKASPFGSQETTLGSSLRSISINFRGKGLECPVDCDEADDGDELRTGEADEPLVCILLELVDGVDP